MGRGTEEEVKSLALVRRLVPYLRPVWVPMAVSLGLVAVVTLLQVLSPLVVAWVIDTVLARAEWRWLLPGALGVVGLALLAGAGRFGQRYLMEVVAQGAIYRLRLDLYQHLQHLSFSFFDRARTGELMSRLTADVETLKQALGMGIVLGVYNLALVLGISVVMLAKDAALAMVSLAFLPFLVYGVVWFGRHGRPVWWLIQEQMAQLSATLQENLTGVRVVRAFGREEAESRRFATQNRLYREKNVRAHRLFALYTNYMQFLTAAGLAAALWYGGRKVVAGELSVGVLIAFQTYLMMLVQPIRHLGWITSLYMRAFVGAGRIFELLDVRPEVSERPGAVTLARPSGEVVLEGVHFAYAGGPPVLRGVSLQVPAGLKVAILGATGSGKSSLVQLIPRFYDPQQGRVLIDGIDVRGATLQSLRQNVAVVMQEAFLFSTTLYENIAFGRPGAGMAEVEAAARAAQIHDFITSLPHGYQTVVGERGVGLSGGQKQRVAIARALLLDAPILILDESTASVDAGTEHLIQAALARLLTGRTAFIIAQRLSTVQNADVVVVLDQGRIAEQGTHQELLSRGGLYRQIYDLQLRPAEELAG